jgi:DNA-binding NarL/FixJ family response regulator
MDQLTLRILLVDDFPSVRKVLRVLLGTCQNWEVVAEAADGEEGLKEVARLQPDVAVVDISMPGMNGLELTRAVRKLVPQTKILILTEYDSQSMIDEARKAGADGYVTKSDASSKLLPAIQALSEHRQFFTSKSISG